MEKSVISQKSPIPVDVKEGQIFFGDICRSWKEKMVTCRKMYCKINKNILRE